MHKPVLLKEVLEILSPKPGENYVDATVNGGGHAKAIIERISPEGKLLAIDRDCELIHSVKNKFKDNKNVIFVCDTYANIKRIAARHNLHPIHGILFDFGFSLHHIEKSGRGFSFLKDEVLDMRYNAKEAVPTAADIVNSWPESKLENIFRAYGEEHFAKQIADAIVNTRRKRPIMGTKELAEIIRRAVPDRYRRSRIHPATRTFQALRIAVNDELNQVEKGLKEALGILSLHGKLIAISFHSLEDRIVKNVFRQEERKKSVRVLTRKVIRPGREEIRANPGSRSAKLRAAQKLNPKS